MTRHDGYASVFDVPFGCTRLFDSVLLPTVGQHEVERAGRVLPMVILATLECDDQRRLHRTDDVLVDPRVTLEVDLRGQHLSVRVRDLEVDVSGTPRHPAKRCQQLPGRPGVRHRVREAVRPVSNSKRPSPSAVN